MSTLPLHARHVKLSTLFHPSSGLSTVGFELPFLLSPLSATLARCVRHKSFVCHSYKKHRGVGYLHFFTVHSSLAARHFLP